MMERRVPGKTVPEVPLIMGVGLSVLTFSFEQQDKRPFLCIGQAPMLTSFQVNWIAMVFLVAKSRGASSLFPMELCSEKIFA